MTQPKISVTILSYNFEKYIGECLESIISQTVRPHEIIVSDDCSTDRSWEIIEEYQRRYPRLLKCLHQKSNIGMTKNARAVLREVTGDFVSSMDGDDRWLPRKLEMEWASLRKNPDARIAYSNVYTIDDDGRRTGIWVDGIGDAPPSGDIFVQICSGTCFPTRMGTYRQELMYRTVVEEFEHEDNVLIFQDLDVKIRATARYRVAYSGEPLVEYRHHGSGIHNSPTELIFKDLLNVYLKNMNLIAGRRAAEVRQIHQGMTRKMYELVHDVQKVCDERLQLIDALNAECRKVLEAAEDRLNLIHRLDGEISEIREANRELHRTAEERLSVIEELQNVAAERLALISELQRTAMERAAVIEEIDAKVRRIEASHNGI